MLARDVKRNTTRNGGKSYLQKQHVAPLGTERLLNVRTRHNERGENEATCYTTSVAC